MITYDYYLYNDSDGLVSSLSRFVDCRELSIAQFLITSAHLQLFLGGSFGRRLLLAQPFDPFPHKRLTQPRAPVVFCVATFAIHGSTCGAITFFQYSFSKKGCKQ